MNILIQIIIFLVTVLILVTVHEFGHFSVAKLLGVKVKSFSIGFGPALFRYRSKADTEYIIAMLPLGGYVKLLDEREAPIDPSERHLAYNTKSLWVRTAIVIAGPFINMLTAIFAFWLIFIIGVTQVRPVIGSVIPNSPAAAGGLAAGSEIIKIDHKPVTNWQDVAFSLIPHFGINDDLIVTAKDLNTNSLKTHIIPLAKWFVNDLNPNPLTSLGIEPYQPPVPAIVNKVMKGGPAYQSGMRSGDKIIELNNKPISDWIKFVEYVQKNPQHPMNLVIMRDQHKIKLSVQPELKRIGWQKLGFLGIESYPMQWPKNMQLTLKYSPLAAISPAISQTFSLFHFNYVVLIKMIKGEISLKSIGGPISIFQTASTAFKEGLINYMAFLGLINIMLAFVNLLPIPGLDGGHLLLFIAEGIKGKPLSLATEAFISRLGFIFLILLIVQASYNDIMRMFS